MYFSTSQKSDEEETIPKKLFNKRQSSTPKRKGGNHKFEDTMVDLVLMQRERGDRIKTILQNKLSETELLFASYAKRLEKLPPRQIAHIKFKISELFYNAETEFLDSQEQVQVIQTSQNNNLAACNADAQSFIVYTDTDLGQAETESIIKTAFEAANM